MKGIIFTEFIHLVEERFGLEVVDKVLAQAQDSGVYTAVGNYDHQKLVKLILQLSQLTAISTAELQRIFGRSVFNNLYHTLPDKSSLQSCQSTFEFIRLVEDYIHMEVKKLYPQTKPPTFVFICETETQIVFDYHSARCMSYVCLGLIEGCAEFFHQQIDASMEKLTDNGSQVRFIIKVTG